MERISIERRMAYLMQWWAGRNRHADPLLLWESLLDEVRRVELAIVEERELAKEAGGAAELGHKEKTW